MVYTYIYSPHERVPTANREDDAPIDMKKDTKVLAGYTKKINLKGPKSLNGELVKNTVEVK